MRARAVKGTWKVAEEEANTTSIRPSIVQPGDFYSNNITSYILFDKLQTIYIIWYL